MLRFLIEKEFRQIFRDPAILRMIFIMPIIQLVVMPLAADYEVKNVNIAVVDHDHSTYSRQLTRQIAASGYFKLVAMPASYTQALSYIETDEADIILDIPQHFERTLIRENEAPLHMSVNAVNGTKANIGAGYLNTIIRQFNTDIRQHWLQLPRHSQQPQILTTNSNWFNVSMSYQKFMVPGILAILLTMVGAFLTALNIVREKEIGTIEQINVTPVRKQYFILGKLIPFWVLGMVSLSLGLIIARVAYGIVPVGSLPLLYAFAAVYMMAVLGLGLLISTYAHTQQQAMLIAFFLMMIFILLGGLYTPIDSMPHWAQVITRFNPVSYFIDVMRMLVLKGSGIADISRHLGIMAIFAVVLNVWAILNYRKRA